MFELDKKAMTSTNYKIDNKYNTKPYVGMFLLKDNKNKELDNFADFTTKKNILEDTKININSNFRNKSYITEKFNITEIRSLNNRIKFLTKNEIQSIDKNIIEELNNLAYNIKKVFNN